jgi:hypothetical protein
MLTTTTRTDEDRGDRFTERPQLPLDLQEKMMAAVSTSTTKPSAPTAGLKVQRLDQDFLYLPTLATGLGSDALGLDRGTTGVSSVVRFSASANGFCCRREHRPDSMHGRGAAR